MAASIFEQIGGFKTVRKVVSDFYDRILEDDELNPHFAKTNMADLMDHQTKFFATLLGGPASYSKEQMRAIHKTMGITEHEFELVCEHAVETLEDHELEQNGIDHARTELLSFKDSILNVE